MKSPISLRQLVGLFLTYAAVGFLIPIIHLSLNSFGAVPFWIVVPDLAVLLLGVILYYLAEHETPTFEPTRLQWLGIGTLSLVIFMGAYLLTTHATQWIGAFPVVFAIIIVFGRQIAARSFPKK